jgi:hypothetical protein
LVAKDKVKNAKMTSNMAITKIESMMKNCPEFLVANLNYAGGHTGHQI